MAAVLDGDDVLGVEVRFAPASSWVVTCERCRHYYLAGRDAKVVCPKCGCLEVGEERLPVLGAADTVVEFDVRGALMGVSLHEARSRLETALVIAGVKGEVSVREP